MKYNQADIILFPHCYLTEGELNKTLETFERLRICLPWYMEPPEALSKTKTDSRVTILYPPENLKPDGNFLPLLSEYRFWMNENVGGSPRISTPKFQKDEASWDIRKAIRPKEENSSETLKDHIIRRHLILHLAGELEKENAGASAVLQKIKATGSPLKEAMGKEHPESILNELPLTAPSSLGEDTQRLNRWIEAWFGLFSPHVQPDSEFLIVNRDIFAFVLDLKKEKILTYLTGKPIHLLEDL